MTFARSSGTLCKKGKPTTPCTRGVSHYYYAYYCCIFRTTRFYFSLSSLHNIRGVPPGCTQAYYVSRVRRDTQILFSLSAAGKLAISLVQLIQVHIIKEVKKLKLLLIFEDGHLVELIFLKM